MSLLAYLAIQLSICGFFGGLPWWGWTAVAWVITTALSLHDAAGLAAQLAALDAAARSHGVACERIDAHINDLAFTDAALAIFDRWCAQGLVTRARVANAASSA